MSDQTSALIQQALAQGNTAQAERLCRQALAQTPNAALQLLLGQLLRRRGAAAEAVSLLEQALPAQSGNAVAWRELAQAALAANRLERADQASAELRKRWPGDAQATFLRGHVLALLHRYAEAQAQFAALGQAAALLQARLGLVSDALARGDAATARFHAQSLVELQPQNPAHWDGLGQSCAAAQDWPASAAALREATRLAPAEVTLWQRRAAVLDAWRQGGEEPVEVRQALLQLQPDSLDALEQLGLAQIGAHRTAAATTTFAQVLARDPGRLLAQWVRFHTPALPCFDSEAERSQWLHDWREGLARFEALPAQAPELAGVAQQILGSVPNFALAYQDGAQLDLHRRHARVVRRLLDLATGGASADADADAAPRPLRQGRRRIGVVSSCLYRHSVTRAWAEALLALPRDDFELYVFHTGSRDDDMVARFRARADGYAGGAAGFADWTRRLRAAELDVLLFLDLGLDVTNQCLAALRHAPVQAATWAHPVTSGAAAIDYFLGADAAEPEQAGTHYSEVLHRLPRLGGCFARPAVAPPAARCESSGVNLLCLQNLYKLHPQHDALFGRILAAAPQTRLEFLTAATAEQAQGFARRLQRSLADYAVDPARVQIHTVLGAEDYVAAVGRADLVLDTMGFSGGITTLDALWQERPWLTLPGECMRGRQSYAMLQLLQLPELIATTTEDYVQRAVALAADSDQRAALSARIAERKHALFEDHAVSTALADFLRTVQPRQDSLHD